MKKGTKKLIGIGLLIIIALVMVYFSFFRSNWEKDGQQKLINFFKLNADPDALLWLMPIAGDFMSGARPIHSDYLINGKITLPGAFMAAYASSYYSKTSTFKIPYNQFNDTIYKMFYAIKRNQEGL